MKGWAFVYGFMMLLFGIGIGVAMSNLDKSEAPDFASDVDGGTTGPMLLADIEPTVEPIRGELAFGMAAPALPFLVQDGDSVPIMTDHYGRVICSPEQSFRPKR
jgi:hypothetical protein